MTFDELLLENHKLKEEILATSLCLRESEGALKERERRLEEFKASEERLKEIIRLLKYRSFAPRSEKLPAGIQEQLFNEIEIEARRSPKDGVQAEQQDLIEVPAHKRARPKRKPLPKDLPRQEVILELKKEERVCPYDGTELKVIGSETSEKLDVIPMQMKVIKHVRLTYACPCCHEFVKTAALEPSPIPKGLVTAGTLSFIATSKFCDGLSLYHIEKIFERNGVEISRGSMAHWMIRMSELSQPLINLMEEDLLGSDYLQMDETRVQVLSEPGRSPQSQSYMWVRCRPTRDQALVLFDYDPSRSGSVAKRLLAEFKGRLQCDGYSGYDEIARSPRIIRHGCLAHARRRFFEAVKSSGDAHIAKHALKLIQKLYRIEDAIKEKPPDEIRKTRELESVPILDEIKTWVEGHIDKVPKQSLTGRALSYLNNEWIYLIRYTEDGRFQIDNNFIENKIRPFALGRKRWLFSQTVDGVNASANLYSIVETAKANRLEPYKYLRHLFDSLPRARLLQDFECLLPWNVKI